MTDLSALDVAKGLLRFFRRQPLAQLAITASLWIPLTLVLRLLASGFGLESLVEQAVAPWSFQAASAGLAFLVASTFLTLSNRAKSATRRKTRGRLRDRALSKKNAVREAQFSKIRDAIDNLDEPDRALLRVFVDHKRSNLPHKAVLPKHQGALQTLSGLNWVWRHDDYASDVYLQDYLYPLLLEHPHLVGSEKNSTLVDSKMAEVVYAYGR